MQGNFDAIVFSVLGFSEPRFAMKIRGHKIAGAGPGRWMGQFARAAGAHWLAQQSCCGPGPGFAVCCAGRTGWAVKTLGSQMQGPGLCVLRRSHRGGIWGWGGYLARHPVVSSAIQASRPGWCLTGGPWATGFGSRPHVAGGRLLTHSHTVTHTHPLPRKGIQVRGLKPSCKWTCHSLLLLCPFLSFRTSNRWFSSGVSAQGVISGSQDRVPTSGSLHGACFSLGRCLCLSLCVSHE